MSAKKMTRVALLSATLYVLQIGFAFLPNIELVSLLIILYTLVFGKEALIIVMIFNLLEGFHWGFGLWWITYLYAWPILCIMTLAVKKIAKEEFVVYAVISGLFGLIFGLLFAIPYLFIDPVYAVTYWTTGLPWDVWHGIWNFLLMLLIGKFLYRILVYLKYKIFSEEFLPDVDDKSKK